MKILKFTNKIPLKNKILVAIIAIVAIFGITLAIIYSVNEDVREWININILNKEITEEDVATIKIDADKNQFICAYDKYIAILCNGKLEGYSSYGSKVYELDVQISNPMFKSNGEYLAIAENNGQKIYIIEERKNLMGWKSRRQH